MTICLLIMLYKSFRGCQLESSLEDDLRLMIGYQIHVGYLIGFLDVKLSVFVCEVSPCAE